MEKNGLVVEADFVTVLRLSSLPDPVPRGVENCSFCCLYASGTEFWDVAIPNISTRGHAGAMAAYVVSPKVARLMLGFYDYLMDKNLTECYSNWDCEIGYWLKARGVEIYVPFKHYGESGGH